MQINSYLEAYTSMTPVQLFGGDDPPVEVARDGDGVITFPVWKVPNLAPPSAAQVATALLAPEPGPSVASLIAYAQAKQIAVLTALDVSSTPNGLTTALDTRCDSDSLMFLGWKRANWVTPNYGVSPAPTCTYYNLDGSGVSVTPAQLAEFLSAVDLRVQATFDAVAAVRSAITASPPTVTSQAQIDAWAWPTA